MAVDERVEAGGVGNDILAGPGSGRGIDTQMAQADDIIRTKGLCLIDGFLDGIVQLGTVVAAEDIVDVTGLLGVHEVGRSGLGKGFRCGNAHKGHKGTLDIEKLDAGQDPQTAAQVDPVAGNVRKIRFLEDHFCAVHAVVKLMVARRGQIIACLIHQPDDGGAIVHGAVCRALDMVASIHQQHILALLLIALLEGCDGSIGQLWGFVVDVSMDIVGIKDGDFRQLAFAKAGRRRGSSYGHSGGSRSDTSGFQKAAARDKSFHEERPPFVFSGFGSDGLFPLRCTVALSLTQNAASGKSKMSNMRKIHSQKVVLFRNFLEKAKKSRALPPASGE